MNKKNTTQQLKRNRSGKWSILTLLVFTITTAVFSNGLPGGYLINQMWRDAHSFYSPLTNTAFHTEAQYLSVYLGHTTTPISGYQTSEGIFLIPVGKIHTLGVTYEGSGAWIEEGKANRWADDGTIVPVDDKLSDRSNTFIFSYAVNPWRGLSMGVNMQGYYHTAFGEVATGFGGDIALSYKISDHEIFGKHLLGLSTHNLLLFGKYDYSSALKLSWYAFIPNYKMESQLDLDLRDFLTKSEEFINGETARDYDFSYKLGFQLINTVKLYGHIGLKSYGFSGGITRPRGYPDRSVSLLYQLTMPFGGELPAHSIFLSAELGEPRKESVEKAEKRKSSLIPFNLYNEAMQLYSDGKYWEAFWIYSKILVEFPNFIKNDWVSYYSGRCLEMLDLRTTAHDQYQRTKIKYSKSKVVPYASSGIMSVQYRQDNTAGVEEQYKQLVNAHVPDSLRNHAHYLRGETYFKDKDYDNALKILSKVRKEHADYIYARHTMVVISVLKDDYDKALEYLKECLGTSPKTPADEELLNRTALFAGYLFYEEKMYPNALAALYMVPRKSMYYEDALLGKGWIALQAQQWQDCLEVARELKTTARWVVNQSEGSLLEAYVHLIQKNYKEAVAILSDASAQLDAAAPPSQEEFDTKNSTYQTLRSEYEALGTTMELFSATQQNTELLQKVDSLHIDQQDMKPKIDNHYKYVDDFNRENFFSRNFEMVREDVDYALARASKMAALKKVTAEIKKSEKKTDDIDKKIEKLREEMENESD